MVCLSFLSYAPIGRTLVTVFLFEPSRGSTLWTVSQAGLGGRSLRGGHAAD